MRGLRRDRQHRSTLASARFGPFMAFSLLLLSGTSLPGQDLRLNQAPVLPEALPADADAKLPGQFQFSSPLLEHGGETIAN